MSAIVFNPFTKNFDFTGSGGGGGSITITGNAGGPQTASAFTIVGTGGLTFNWDGTKFVIAGSSSGFTWNNVTGSTQSMSSGNGYVCSNAGLTTLTLPAVASTAFGDMIKVISFGAGGFKIAQNSGNQMLFGNMTTTAGVTGFIQTDPSETYSAIELVCIVQNGTNAIWSLESGPLGNMTVN